MAPASPPPPSLEPLLALWGLLLVGFAYAAWFRRQRVAWGFAVLGWITLGSLSQALLGMVGYVPDARLAALVWQLAPCVLLLVLLAPAAALRRRAGMGLALLLVAGLATAAVAAGRLESIPSLEALLLGRLPPELRAWLTPLAPLLGLLAALVAFTRWQLTEDPGDLACFAAATILLVTFLLPEQAAVGVAAAAGVLLAALAFLAHRMAFVDALTRLPNRRALETALSGLPNRYAIAMADIDHFKQINDRHGHDVGDQVLRMAASRLRQVRGCRAYRYGGEEFCLLFRGRSIAAARRHCEAARAAVAEPPMALRAPDRPAKRPRGRRRGAAGGRQTIEVTISIGLAFAEGGAAPAVTVERADRALYRAKRAGRNRVVAVGKPAR